jgi:hypothetical protein
VGDDGEHRLADRVAAVLEEVDGLVYDALESQVGGASPGAKERERELTRARRALVKAEQVLRQLGA